MLFSQLSSYKRLLQLTILSSNFMPDYAAPRGAKLQPAVQLYKHSEWVCPSKATPPLRASQTRNAQMTSCKGSLRPIEVRGAFPVIPLAAK